MRSPRDMSPTSLLDMSANAILCFGMRFDALVQCHHEIAQRHEPNVTLGHECECHLMRHRHARLELQVVPRHHSSCGLHFAPPLLCPAFHSHGHRLLPDFEQRVATLWRSFCFCFCLSLADLQCEGHGGLQVRHECTLRAPG